MPPSTPSTTTTFIPNIPATEDQTPKPDELRGKFTPLFLLLRLLTAFASPFYISHLLPLPLTLLLFPSLLSFLIFSPKPVPRSQQGKSQHHKRTLLTSCFHQAPPAGSASSCNGAVCVCSVRPSICPSNHCNQPSQHSTLQARYPSIPFPLACTTPKQESHPTSNHTTHRFGPSQQEPAIDNHAPNFA